jgi:hypothetical protein
MLETIVAGLPQQWIQKEAGNKWIDVLKLHMLACICRKAAEMEESARDVLGESCVFVCRRERVCAICGSDLCVCVCLYVYNMRLCVCVYMCVRAIVFFRKCVCVCVWGVCVCVCVCVCIYIT